MSRTENYIRLTGLKDTDYLISRLAKTKAGHNAVGTKPLSYSRISAIFHEFMDPVLRDSQEADANISLHSLRSGGASQAASSNVPDRQIKKHGRWRSDVSRDRYIKDSKDNRLVISKLLGL